jgi:hypothetical protein
MVTVKVTGALSGAVLLSSINSQLGGLGYTFAVEYLFYPFFVLCLLCIISFLMTERLHVRQDRWLSRIEASSRLFYAAGLGVTVAAAMIFGIQARGIQLGQLGGHAFYGPRSNLRDTSRQIGLKRVFVSL